MVIAGVLFFITIIAGPIVLGLIGWFKTRSSPDHGLSEDNETSLPSAMPRVVNAVVLYVLAFNLIFFVQELFLVLPKVAIGGMRPTLFHNNQTVGIEHPAIGLTEGGGAVAIFIVGLIFVGVFMKLRTSTSVFKWFALWMAYHGLVQSIPQVTLGVIDPGLDFGEAMTYLNIGEPLGIIFSIISNIALVAVGLLITRPLLEMAPSTMLIASPGRRTKFILQVGMLITLLGAILIIPFRIPPLELATGPFIIAFFAMPWALANAWRVTDVQAIGNAANERISWVAIGLTVILLAVFQLVLAPGIRFY